MRKRFWKNEAAEPDAADQYGAENIGRMTRGSAPRRQRPDGSWESMELSHEPTPERDDGTLLTPHAAQDGTIQEDSREHKRGAGGCLLPRDRSDSYHLWVRDDDGSPTPVSSSGRPAFPYWPSEARAQRAAQLWGAQFRAFPMPLDHWQNAALPDLAKDDFRVGINWSGQHLTGWDFTVNEVVNRLIHALGEPPYDR